MATNPLRPFLQAGQDWLLNCTRSPTAVGRAWFANHCARIPNGEHWQLACPPVLYATEEHVRQEGRVGSGRLAAPAALGAAFGSSGQLHAEAHG